MTWEVAARRPSSWWPVVLRVAVLLVCALQIGATQCGRSEVPPGHREFLALPFSERPRALASYPLREQVDLYLSAMLVKHPPQLELADVLAASGSEVLPILIERIRGEEHDLDKVNLIYVVERMQELGYLPIASDAKIMAALRAEIASMKDGGWRTTAEESLERIVASSGEASGSPRSGGPRTHQK